MNSNSLRPRGVLGYILDNGILKDAITDAMLLRPYFANHSREEVAQRITPMATVAILHDHSTEWAVINSEGVGHFADKDGTARVYFWLDANYMDSVELDLPTIDGCMDGGHVDIADFIRTFGDRLHANHYAWYSWARNKRGTSVGGVKRKRAELTINSL